MKKIKNILLWLWQLPQHMIAGFYILYLFIRDFKNGYIIEYHDLDCTIIVSDYAKGGVCLGEYIILNSKHDSKLTSHHEYGHTRQSRMFGPLYLLVIGLPSLIHNITWSDNYGESYYDYWCESWADKLGGIKRDEYGNRYVE